MLSKKRIFAINGSASENSSNQKLIDYFSASLSENFEVTQWENLKLLPHFDPEFSDERTPQIVLDFRENISLADGVLICSPEYIFSIPSGLKNALEWCVASLVFSDKPLAIITASANGEKGHEQLKLIMKMLMAHFNDESARLIKGIKGKVQADGRIHDMEVRKELDICINALIRIIPQN